MSLHKDYLLGTIDALEDKKGSSWLRRQQKSATMPTTRSHLHPITSTGEKLLKNLQVQLGLFHRTTTRDVATPEGNPEDCTRLKARLLNPRTPRVGWVVYPYAQLSLYDSSNRTMIVCFLFLFCCVLISVALFALGNKYVTIAPSLS